MDNIDVKILNALRKNARENASDIAEKVNLSVSAVIERIKKLEQNGTIKQFTIVLDAKQIGEDVVAFVEVLIEHPKFNDSFIEFVKANNYIVECHYVAGEYDFLLKVATDTINTLERLLNEIKGVIGVSKTKTIISLSTVKNEFATPLKSRKIKK